MLRRAALLALILTTACNGDLTRPPESDAPALRGAGSGPGFLSLPVDDAVWSMAYGVSEGGWAAGEIDLDDTDWHAARWRISAQGGSAHATLDDLGKLNGRATIAFDVNVRGDVVGGSVELSTGIGSGPDEAFVYRNHSMQALPTLGGANAFARRINNLGVIAGQSETADGESHATVWRPRAGGGYTAIDLGTLGGSFSWCNTIDDFGRVVGLSETETGAIVAWTWDGHGPLRRLRSLTPGGDNFAVDNNLWGIVVGNGSDGNGNLHAARWSHGGVQDLHGRFPGFEQSLATGVSLANDIVASAYDADFNPSAFLLRGNQRIDLGAAAGTPSSDVYDISDLGWIAGGSGADGTFTAGLWLPGGLASVAALHESSAARHTTAGREVTRLHQRALRSLRTR